MSARLLLSDAIPVATRSVADTVGGMGADKLKTDLAPVFAVAADGERRVARALVGSVTVEV